MEILTYDDLVEVCRGWQARAEKAEAEAAKLQAFKDYVHQRLADHGVPHHPPGVHSAAGCRIGDRLDWLFAEMERLKSVKRTTEKMFPIQTQRGAVPHPLSIPWSIAELAYSVYAANYGKGQSLEYLAQRGGFGPGEMDMFLPGWREMCSEINRLTSGRLTPEEFQTLCHNLNERGTPCTREEFEKGCVEFQNQLFGEKQ